MKKLFRIFAIAFISNLVWENLHSFLYATYRGGKITELILLRATLADAIIICIITAPFSFVPLWKKHSWLIIPIGFLVSASIEWYALATGRWAYNPSMPIVPFLTIGVTPFIQLGLLGYFSFRISEQGATGISE